MRNSPVVIKALEAWSNAATVWGKISVACFYLALTLIFLMFLVLVIDPSNAGLSFDCMLHGISHDSAEWIQCFVRCWSLTALALMYYIGEVGALNTPNVFSAVVYFWLIWVIIAKATGKKLDDTTCVPELIDAVYKTVMLGLPTVSFVMLLLEGWLAPSSASETQPLVTD